MMVARLVDGQGFLVPLAEDIKDMKKMYRLNPLGWFIWEVLDHVTDLGALSERIADEFDVDGTTAFEDAENFINLVGMESPGLTSSPAIAKMVVQMIKGKVDLKEKDDFSPIRKRTTPFNEASRSGQDALIKGDPDYGEIVCRCEHVSKREVVDALNNPFSSRTISAVKYRTRVGMGRCHGGFCLPRIVEILEEEYALLPEEIKLKNSRSPLFVGKTKALREDRKDE